VRSPRGPAAVTGDETHKVPLEVLRPPGRRGE